MSRILEPGKDKVVDFDGAGAVIIPAGYKIGAISFFESSVIASITEADKTGDAITGKSMMPGSTLFSPGISALTMTSGSGRCYLVKDVD